MDDHAFCLLKEECQGLNQKPGILADQVSGYEIQKIREFFLKLGMVWSEAEAQIWSKTKLKASFGVCDRFYNLVFLSSEAKRSMCLSQLRCQSLRSK